MGSKRRLAVSYTGGLALALGIGAALLPASEVGASPGSPGTPALSPVPSWVQSHPAGAPSPTLAPPARSVFAGPTVGSQLAELIPISGNADGFFGDSVAVSGSTAVIGAYGQTAYGNVSQGVAYVYVKSGTSWVEQAELTASDGAANDEFGLSVAISGSTIVVGAPNHTVDGFASAGAAYVFTKSGSVWVQSGELAASDPLGNSDFGTAVSISSSTIAVTEPNQDYFASVNSGHAYVFTKSGTAWNEKAELFSPTTNDFYGEAASLSGTTLVVGAPYRTEQSGAAPYQGALDVYTLSNGTWKLQADLTSGGTDGFFGISVATTGSTLVAGASGQSEEGAAYVFAKSGSTWSQQAELTDPAGGADSFGTSVALSGSTALIGAPGTTVDDQDGQGVTYVYTKSGTTWSEKAALIAIDGTTFDGFGLSVSLSSSTALVGAPGHTVGADTDQGAAYVFDA